MNFSLVQKKLRLKVLNIVFKSGASHIGSIFSCIDIIYLIFKKYIFKKNINHFILSKGHAGLGYYVVLNYFNELSQNLLNSYMQNGSILTGHISHKVPSKKIQISTGSLGHGLSISTGIALQKKIDKKKGIVFCLISDGECDEGANWEAALFAAHHKLNNLVVFIDYNKLQNISKIKDVINLEPLKKKWQSFGWHVEECDGHDFEDIYLKVKKTLKNKVKPKLIICHTIKGKGSRLMENKILWHYRTPTLNEKIKIEKEIVNYN